jgi:phage terminase small subunit
MARPRTPSAKLELNGSFDKDAKRRRVDPVASGPLGKAPIHFDKSERDVWDELKKIALPGVLTNADRWLVELACRLMARQRKEGIGGRYGLNNGETSILEKFISKMGMTPSDRAKLAVPPPKSEKEEDDFSDLDDDSSEGKRVN